MYQLLSWNYSCCPPFTRERSQKKNPSPETDAGPMGDARSIQVSGQQGNRDEVRLADISKALKVDGGSKFVYQFI